MIRYIITYLTLILSRGRLLGGEFLRQWFSRFDSMTAVTVQPKSHILIPQDEAQAKAVQIRPKLDACKTSYESIGDRSADHHTTINDMAADRRNLWPKLPQITIAPVLSWHPTCLPQAVETEGCMKLRNSIDEVFQTMHNHLLRLRQNVTGCQLRTAGFLEVECPVAVLQNPTTTPTVAEAKHFEKTVCGSRTTAIGTRMPPENRRYRL